jgi:glycosyltransferase involved in cell wall biosynthesis
MSSPESPSISLITVCWNAASTIERTLQSVISQSILPREYLFIDGGSDDGTLELIMRWTPRFAAVGVAVRLIPQVRIPGQAGITSAWNQALKEVHGDIIAILNADDCYFPEALSHVRAAFAADDAIDAVAGVLLWRDAQGKTTGRFAPRSLKLLPYLMPLPHPACFFRRRVYECLGDYDASYRLSADYDFVWRCFRAGIRWRFIPDELVAMQIGGAANTARSRARLETYRIARKNLPFWDLRPLVAFITRIITRR